MKDFILAEAKDKASDINKKCEEDFSIEAKGSSSYLCKDILIQLVLISNFI